ncbi:MAG: outer membrane protein transport protein [Rhizomicrobium sp.]
MRRSAITIICTSCLLSVSAYATGFDLREFSASSLGTSYAGAGANGQHASTMAFNPALLGQVDDFDISVSATGILPSASGDFTTALTAAGTPNSGTKTPSSIISKALIPEIAIRKRLSDQFSVGVTLSVPWGLMTKYPDTWAGRYFATKSELKTYNITPAVAYQPIPELSIAAGLQVEYIKGNLGKAIDFGTLGYLLGEPTPPGGDDGSVMLSADNWAYGFVLGVAWQPNDDLSLGLSYRSKIDHTLKGTETFTPDPANIMTFVNANWAFINAHSPIPVPTFLDSPTANARITMPSVINLSGRLRIDDRWTAMATVDWTGWSVLKQLLVLPGSAQPYNAPDLTSFNWKDSWFGSLGAEYKADDQWTLRVGTAYDESPTPSGGATPGIPDSGRIMVSGGVGYRVNDHVDVDFSVAHLFDSHAVINQLGTAPENALRGTLIGSVSTGITLVGMELTYR